MRFFVIFRVETNWVMFIVYRAIGTKKWEEWSARTPDIECVPLPMENYPLPPMPLYGFSESVQEFGFL